MTAKNDFVDNNVPLDVVDAAWLNEVATKANTAYLLPVGGITAADLDSGVTSSLAKADSAIQTADLAAAQLIPIFTYTDHHTLVIGEANSMIEMNSATGVNVTIPPHASVPFPVGAEVEVSQIGTGQVTLVAGAGVNLQYPASLVTRTQFAALRAIQRAVDVWIISGDAQ